MKKKAKIVLLLFWSLLLIVGASGCDRQQMQSKAFRVGVVNLSENLDKVYLGFKEGIAGKGFEEGKNITFLYNGFRPDIPSLEKDLKFMIDQQVDLILSITTPATKKAKMMTAGTGIPVVFAPVYDPVSSGIVESLVKPGGNITGIKVGGSSGKALEWLLKIAPDTKNIFIPFSKNNKATVQSLKGIQKAAEKLDVQLSLREVNDKKELIGVLENVPDNVDALWLLNSHFLIKHTSLFVETAIRHKFPLGSSTFQVDDGVLIAYGQNAYRTGEMAGSLAGEILRGVLPANLPVEITGFFLGINLKTANAIAIDIPNDILHVADTIIRP